MSTLKIPAWRPVPVGTLYNAQIDNFLAIHVLDSADPNANLAQKVRNNNSIEQERLRDESLASKFNFLRSPLELGASVLAGSIEPSACGQQLLAQYDTRRYPRQALRISFTNYTEKLSFLNEHVKQCFSSSSEDLKRATHIVAEVFWGTECVVIASKRDHSTEEASAQSDLISACLDHLERAAAGSTLDMDAREAETFEQNVELILHGDILGLKNPRAASFSSTVQLFSGLRRNEIRFFPIMYSLIPVEVLGYFLPFQVQSSLQVKQPNAGRIQEIFNVFESLTKAQGLLDRHHSSVNAHQMYVPQSHIHDVSFMKDTLHATYQSFRQEYARLLYKVRRGEADSQELTRLLSEFESGDLSFGRIASLAAKFNNLLEFLARAVSLGAHYFGHNGRSFNPSLLKHYNTAYVFSFNEQVSRESDSWADMTIYLLDQLSHIESRSQVILLDHDGLREQLTKPTISLYRNGQVITEDVWKQEELLSRCSVISVDRSRLYQVKGNISVTQRRPVKMPCGHSTCDQQLRLDWICRYCHSMVEYISDRIFSCTCGQWNVLDSRYKCDSATHGRSYVRHGDETKLDHHLQRLESYEELNILILGESGVGKRAFLSSTVRSLQSQENRHSSTHSSTTSISHH